MKKTTSTPNGQNPATSQQPTNRKKPKTPAQKGITLYQNYIESEKSLESLKALKTFKDEGNYGFNKIGLGHVANELTEAFSKMNTTTTKTPIKTSTSYAGHQGAYNSMRA